MEVKVQCGCGTKYKFDVEPVNGRMPIKVQCPNCGNDGTTDANQFIARKLQFTPPSTTTIRPIAIPSPVMAPAPTVAAPAPPPAPMRLAGASSAGAAVAEAAPATAYHGQEARTLLERTTWFIKERVAILKLTDTYDILDPANGHQIGIAKEEPPVWAKWMRLVTQKHRLPTAINVYETEGQPPVLSMRRGFTFVRAKIRVVSGDGRELGHFRSKLISIGGGFHVFDHAGQQVAEVKGDWKGWNFKFLNQSGRELGTVTKKWAGLGRELFTSADNYIIALTDLNGVNPETSALLLAAGLSIDIVYKEAE